jgi:catechol 2,3-dioxygenase-like lactoylglutathione lyase family enzyme
VKSSEVKSLKAHLALNVRSLDKSLEFYQKLFGIEPSKVRSGYANSHKGPFDEVALTLRRVQPQSGVGW